MKIRFDVIGQLGSMRRYARALTRDATDAEDLVHDALVRAYERRETFRQGSSLRAWLLSVLHNSFIDRARSRRAEAARVVQSGYIAETRMEPPQDHVVRLAQVREAFLDLPEEQRSALHLVAVEGLSYQQASSALGIPLGTLMSRIGRARASLRDMEDNAAGQAKGFLRIVGGRDERDS